MNSTLEKRVAEQTSELELVNQELDAFCSSVSHDLRSPLRHIDGFLELLSVEARDRLSQEAKGYLERLGLASQAMGNLIAAVLRFSRSSATELQWESIDMNQLVREVLAPLQETGAGRVIEWQVGELPTLRADRALLAQVWMNLLENAVKFTRTRPKAHISIQALFQGSEYQFSIQDNGVGFDMGSERNLFGVFQRLHHPSEFEGTGIGLATARRIVVRHGGRIWAESTLDQGATFHFTLKSS